jgi:EAL domain-containing protein (putative c-di-GMP-specific phosphodiesterase class I)
VFAFIRDRLDKGECVVPISMNVSRQHMKDLEIIDYVRDLCDTYKVPTRYLEFELTETMCTERTDRVMEFITAFHKMGMKVSMDDFGSGYSSLNSLKDMPLDVLKLDAEFFRGENVDGRSEIVVSETIKLAQSLEMKTVAEGVEAKETVDFLADQGCDMIQGFYFARPMPGSEFEQKMIEGIASIPE